MTQRQVRLVLAFLCAPWGLVPLEARAGDASQSNVKEVSAGYERGGPNADGFEAASVTVRYAVRHCFGTVDLQVVVDPSSLYASGIYWFEGQRHDLRSVPGLIPEGPSYVVLTVDVTGLGATRWNSRVTASSQAGSCMDTQLNLGPVRDFWAKDAPEAERARVLESFGILAEIDRTLRSTRAEAYIREQANLRRKEEEAAERKRKEEVEAAERKRKEEVEAAERKRKEEAAVGGTDAGSVRLPSPGGTGAPSGTSSATSRAEYEESQRRAREAGQRYEQSEQARRARLASEAREREQRARAEARLQAQRRAQQEAAVMEMTAAAAPAVYAGTEVLVRGVDRINSTVPLWLELAGTARLLVGSAGSAPSYSGSFRVGSLFFLSLGYTYAEVPPLQRELKPNVRRSGFSDNQVTYLSPARGQLAMGDFAAGVSTSNALGRFHFRAEFGGSLSWVQTPGAPALGIEGKESWTFAPSVQVALTYTVPRTPLLVGFGYRVQPWGMVPIRFESRKYDETVLDAAHWDVGHGLGVTLGLRFFPREYRKW